VNLRPFAAAGAFVVLAASSALACSVGALDPNELIENPTTWSANGRFCVIVRWHPTIADFASERAGTVYGLDLPEPLTETEPPPVAQTITAAFYELRGRSRVLVAEIPLNADDAASDLLVSNSGRYVVTFHNFGRRGCTGQLTSEDRLLSIYRIGETQFSTWKVGDVVSAYDLMQLSGKLAGIELRNESSDREIVALRIPAPAVGEPRFEERRIDLATGSLLDPKRDIYPTPHGFASITPRNRRVDGSSRDCSAASSTPIRLASDELLARAIRGPLPELPIVAYKARIRGTVISELVISERGAVLCVRSTNLPFGLTAAAEEAVRRWKFKPYIIDGHAVPVIGEIAFHFEDVDAETWATLTRGLPPRE
jgi:hypothetical protein